MVDLSTHTDITLKLARSSEGSEVRLAEALISPPAVDGSPMLAGCERLETYLRIGISPLPYPRRVLSCPYSVSRHSSHPLLLAAAMQDYDAELADSFVSRVDEDVILLDKHKDRDRRSGGTNGWWYAGSYTWTIAATDRDLRPEKPSTALRCGLSNSLTFNPTHAEWYSAEALNPRMEEDMLSYRAATLLTRLHRSLKDDPSGLLRVKNLATKFVRKALQGRAKPQAYSDLAKCIRYCHQDDVANLIEQHGGAFIFLLSFLNEVTEEQMVRGLRQIAKSFIAGLKLLPRAPTIPELRKLSGTDAHEILVSLPKEFLEELKADAEGLRGLLIGKVDNLEEMQRCVSDHKDRPMRAYEILNAENIEGWGAYKRKIVDSYVAARAYREAVELLDVPHSAATHLLMAHWTKHEHHAPALGWLQHFPELEKPLLACQSPFRVSMSPGGYKHVEYATYAG